MSRLRAVLLGASVASLGACAPDRIAAPLLPAPALLNNVAAARPEFGVGRHLAALDIQAQRSGSRGIEAAIELDSILTLLSKSSQGDASTADAIPGDEEAIADDGNIISVMSEVWLGGSSAFLEAKMYVTLRARLKQVISYNLVEAEVSYPTGQISSTTGWSGGRELHTGGNIAVDCTKGATLSSTTTHESAWKYRTRVASSTASGKCAAQPSSGDSGGGGGGGGGGDCDPVVISWYRSNDGGQTWEFVGTSNAEMC
ncbi:MAG: hypothetical protein AB1941_09815 [Gemmatimonadota bacterium]